MEKNVVQIADKFIFVTEENRKDYLNQYKVVNSKSEFTYILNRGFDKELYNKLSLESTPQLINKNKINMVYTGEIFTKLRNINPFIEALEEIRDENKDDYELLNILFLAT